jgi:subtilisin family serine protease
VLHARGWRESPGAANAVVRLVSETENSLVARNRLEVEFPGTRFGLNFVYSLANDSMPHGSKDVMASARSCAPERCYGPALINWRADLASCAVGVKIGVIDTTVDEAHPALAWRKLNVHQAPHKATSDPPDWHGTGVVSLLAGSPKSGTPGLVPDADYVIANAFFKNTSGQSETDTVHLLWALKVLEQHGAHVVNMSLSGPRDELVHQRLIELSRRGMIFVAAAGNGGPDAPAAYPAAYKNEVIAVTAVDRNKRTYDHASLGDYIDVAAPGVRIWTALPNNREGALSGTSFAAPFVTAIVAAIYKQTLLPQISDPSHSRALEALTLAHLSTANLVRDEKVGLGLVRAPSGCAAAERHLAPSAKLTPSIVVGGWNALVHAFSQSDN